MDLDEVAHYEQPHQDLRCLQFQQFSSLVLKELNASHSNFPTINIIFLEMFI